MGWVRRLSDALRPSWWVAILRDHDTEPVELGSAVTKMTLGLQLLWPVSTYANAQSFSDLRAIPEPVLGIGVFCVGLGHAYALRDGNVSWRRAAAALSAAVWFLFAITFFHGLPSSFGAWMFVMGFVASTWCHVRLGLLLR